MTTARRTFAWIFVAIAILFAPNAALATGPVYTAIVDAGSGGTRLFFYKVTKAPYPELKLLFKQVVDDIPDASYQPDDGIDNYACPPGDDPAAQAFYATKNVNPNVMFPLWNGLKAELSAMTPAVNPADVIVKVFATERSQHRHPHRAVRRRPGACAGWRRHHRRPARTRCARGRSVA